jgi:hypothetical protein
MTYKKHVDRYFSAQPNILFLVSLKTKKSKGRSHEEIITQNIT